MLSFEDKQITESLKAASLFSQLYLLLSIGGK